MKTFLATLLVLFLSVPTAMAGSIDGKGIWCDRPSNEFGYWFENSKYTKYSITGHMIDTYHSLLEYREVGTDEIEIGASTLNRKTLEIRVSEHISINRYQCYLVNSPKAIDDILKDSIAQGKAENKL